MKDSLRMKLASRSERYEEVGMLLSQPDVTVTNASDKVVQLGKLSKLDERVRAAMATA